MTPSRKSPTRGGPWTLDVVDFMLFSPVRAGKRRLGWAILALIRCRRHASHEPRQTSRRNSPTSTSSSRLFEKRHGTPVRPIRSSSSSRASTSARISGPIFSRLRRRNSHGAAAGSRRPAKRSDSRAVEERGTDRARRDHVREGLRLEALAGETDPEPRGRAGRARRNAGRTVRGRRRDAGGRRQLRPVACPAVRRPARRARIARGGPRSGKRAGVSTPAPGRGGPRVSVHARCGRRRGGLRIGGCRLGATKTWRRSRTTAERTRARHEAGSSRSWVSGAGRRKWRRPRRWGNCRAEKRRWRRPSGIVRPFRRGAFGGGRRDGSTTRLDRLEHFDET